MNEVDVRFDARIADEARLIEALAKLPVERRNEYLRRLAVAGFRLECPAVPAVTSPPAPTPALPSPQASPAADQPADASPPATGPSIKDLQQLIS